MPSISPIKTESLSDDGSFKLEDDVFSLPQTRSHSPVCLSPTTESTSDTSECVVEYHPRYYVKDDMTVFLVNNKTLFRVHRYFLDRESDVFRGYPSGTEEEPVKLPNVQPHDFEVLLDYFYDSVHDNAPKSVQDWITLLSISSQFNMAKVRDRSIREIEAGSFPGDDSVTPVVRIVLATKYDITQWLKPAYIALCGREEPILEEEGEKLGLGIVIKLARAREIFRKDEDLNRDFRNQATPNLLFDSSWGRVVPVNISPPRDLERDIEMKIDRIVTDIFWAPSLSIPGTPLPPVPDLQLPGSSTAEVAKKGKKLKGGKVTRSKSGIL